jgi:hypothetical protein
MFVFPEWSSDKGFVQNRTKREANRIGWCSHPIPESSFVYLGNFEASLHIMKQVYFNMRSCLFSFQTHLSSQSVLKVKDEDFLAMID